MSRTPPVPQANQSPFPIAEPSHEHAPETAVEQASQTLNDGVTAARDAAAPLIEQAKAFAKARPWATAALVGSIGLAVLNTLRGRR